MIAGNAARRSSFRSVGADCALPRPLQHPVQDVQHVAAAAARRDHGVDVVAVEQRADAVAVAREQAREHATKSVDDAALAHVARAEVDRRAEVEQEPRRDLAVLVVLAHVRRLQPRRDVPVDVADVVVVLVFAQVGEVEAEAAEQRAVVAVQQAVEPAEHRPLEPPQDALRIARSTGDVPPGGSGCDASDMRLERLLGRAESCCMILLDELVGVEAFGQRLVRQHQPMAQHVGRQVGHVLGQHVVAAAQEGERARALDQVDRRARARAEREVLREVGEAVALGLRASPTTSRTAYWISDGST